jgi:hypothetical protein
MRGGITWDAKRRAGNRDRRDLCFPTLAASSATAHARIGRGILLATCIPPHPYSAKKILVFNEMRDGYRCKILQTKELFAEYSYQRSYGVF